MGSMFYLRIPKEKYKIIVIHDPFYYVFIYCMYDPIDIFDCRYCCSDERYDPWASC